MNSEVVAEVQELRDQLAEIDPFRALSPQELTTAATSCTVLYRRGGDDLLEIGQANDGLFVIASGSGELRDPTGVLVERLGEGALAGVVSTVSGDPVPYSFSLIEDSILYRIEGEVLRRLRASSDEFDQYLVRLFAGRLGPGAGSDPQRWPLLVECRSLVGREPVTVGPDETVAVASRLMTSEGTASVAVVDDSGLVGIVTDRDLRSRVLAAGLDGSVSVADVMTADPVTIDGDLSAHDAQLVMTERNIHHLPVVDGHGAMLGVIHRNDLYKLRNNDPVLVAGEIAKAADPGEIAAVTARVPKLIEALVASDALAEAIGRLVTSVTDAVTRRLCVLAEAELGPPPIGYAFVCFGSQARREQTAFTDQDNALILETDATGDAAAYFERLATLVCDGLATAGYRYCPGDIMATNPIRRVGLDTWKRYVAAWVGEPAPEAVLNASVYFDCRHVHGEGDLTDDYVATTRAVAGPSQLFLGQMAANAADFRPPLGFFRRFVVEKDGAQKDRFDLKRSGITPVVELGRVYALETGAEATNTYDRIRLVGETEAMAPADAADLAAALEHIAYVRLQHQRRQLSEGTPPDNHLDPTTLNRFERDQLKMAFVTIDRHQDAMRRRFKTGQMG